MKDARHARGIVLPWLFQLSTTAEGYAVCQPNTTTVALTSGLHIMRMIDPYGMQRFMDRLDVTNREAHV
jgi:hypothetical protein